MILAGIIILWTFMIIDAVLIEKAEPAITGKGIYFGIRMIPVILITIGYFI